MWPHLAAGEAGTCSLLLGCCVSSQNSITREDGLEIRVTNCAMWKRPSTSLRITFLLGKEEKTGPVGEAVVREGLLKEA